jgi:stage II sporulation protein D
MVRGVFIMKKLLIFIVTFMIVPCGIVLTAGIFFDELQVGGGNNSLESQYMGKTIQIELQGLNKNIDLEEYVAGVLPGIISIDYEQEALKTQAVLVRTNVLKEMTEKNTSDAEDLSYHYMSVEERITLFGDRNYEKNERKIRQAVADTAGMVIKQEDSLIMALYHEVSIGKTVSAEEVLGENVDYLQSVDSSQDVEAKHYMNMVVYTWEEVAERIGESGDSEVAEDATSDGEASEDATVDGEASSDAAASQQEETTEEQGETTENQENKVEIAVVESTENGFVQQVSVEGNVMSGEEAMELFDLSSTNFYVEEVEGGVRFICLGKGSCLGVSQYGANCLASQGKNYEEIIHHYFQNVTIEKYNSSS